MPNDIVGGDGFDKPTLTWRTAVPSVARWLRNLPRAFRVSRRDDLDTPFVEKVVLAVTAVNECESCSRVHTERAQDAGVREETVRRILERDVGAAVDDDELPALEFAQRFAEANADPDPEAVAALREAYDPETVEVILAAAHDIHFANLVGNTVERARMRAGTRLRQLRDLPRTVGEAIRGAL